MGVQMNSQFLYSSHCSSNDSEPRGHGSPSVMGGGVLVEAVHGRTNVCVCVYISVCANMFACVCYVYVCVCMCPALMGFNGFEQALLVFNKL